MAEVTTLREAVAEMVEDGDSVVSMPEIFNYWLQAGRVDVGFLGGAQIDRYGTINTTVIGPYDERRCTYPAPGERLRSPLRPKR